MFSSEGDKGVFFIDAVCFIVKAPDARLTVSQKYIFSSIMSLFGKDIESNICILITFADGANPPILASLSEANLPSVSYFQFNNSALFAENKNLATTSMSPMFWEMGCKSFQKFFDQLKYFPTKSLTQTKNVLKEREQLKTVVACIPPLVKAWLSKLSELRNDLEVFKKHKDDIEDNKDFEYEVEETIQVKAELRKGKHVTNCLRCNITCHEGCGYADDNDKRLCCAMTNDYCTVCIGKCIWSHHKNAHYSLKYTIQKVRKSYIEMKQKYERAIGLKMNHKTFIGRLKHDVDDLFKNVQLQITKMNRCQNRLEEIALRTDPLSTIDLIDLMIQAEEMEGKPGYEQRIVMLNEFKHMSQIEKDFENFSKHFKSAKEEMASVGLSDASDKDEDTSVWRGVNFLTNLFSPSPSPTFHPTKRLQNKKNKKERP